MKGEDDGGHVFDRWPFSMTRTPRQYNRIGMVVRKKKEEQEEEKQGGLGFHPWT